ncbi:MAG: DUF2971 domain-containing protein [Sphingomonadaceae bacterium]|nr:DUF2971 domain-containing protein [Sphingomonadaceae bacterium]
MESSDILRRYTSLPVLIDMLVRNAATLLSYQHWIDDNDRRALQLYQDTLRYGFVGAMCLTQSAETFHHWSIFAPGDAGVCIVFDRKALTEHFRDRPHFMTRSVEYVLLDRIGAVNAEDIHLLPFLKRYGFRDEREFRIVGFAPDEAAAMGFEVRPALIRRVVFSPFVHPNLVNSARIALHAIPGWQGLEIGRSNLTNNETWQGALVEMVDRHGVIYGPWLPVEGSVD